MFPDVYIRVDAGPISGFGHFTRCLSLAYMIADKRRKIVFASVEIDEVSRKKINDSGFESKVIDDDEVFLAMPRTGDIVIVDNYNIHNDYHKKLKDCGFFLVLINDIPSDMTNVDLVINHTPGILESDFAENNNTHYALGPEYALLRPSFLQAAANSVSGFRRKKTVWLVCFGGADPQNLTASTLDILRRFTQIKTINVVIGKGYANPQVTSEWILNDPRVIVHYDIGEKDMLDLMCESEVAIVPASVTLLEVIAVGNRIISGYYVDNQKLVYGHLRKTGIFWDAENFFPEKIEQAIEQALSDGSNEERHRIIDGKSGQRIKSLINRLSFQSVVRLRRADMVDVDITYEWAKNPVVRQYAFSSAAIQRSEHEAWFKKKINDPDTVFLIAEYGKERVGSVRFDIKNREALISYLVSPEFHGLGLGGCLLQLGIDYLKGHSDVQQIIGYVMPQNDRSIAVFRKLYFKEEQEADRIKFQFNIS